MTEGDACRYTPSMIKSLLAGMMVAAVCAVQAGEYGDSAVRAARELSGAVKTGDMMWMIEKMYPPMKKQLVASFPGGEASFMETMREKMQAAAAVMKERGMVVETYEIGQPAAEHLVKGGGEVLVVLPTRMVISMKRPDGVPVKVENTGVLVLVKDLKDKGPWTFIDASRMNANGLRSMFYDLSLIHISEPTRH